MSKSKYNLTRRLKEFSVRKVFGASVMEIFRLMSRDYLTIVIISFAAGAPAGAWMMNVLLNAIYPTHIPFIFWPYVLAISLMVAMIGLTILSQFRRVTYENPTETLRVN